MGEEHIPDSFEYDGEFEYWKSTEPTVENTRIVTQLPSRRCSQCEQIVPFEALFCSRCGAQFSELTAEEMTPYINYLQSARNDSTSKTKLGTGSIILIVICLVVVSVPLLGLLLTIVLKLIENILSLPQ